ncbi:class I tRNA ligase family protein, partial [Patescibacteria group bacterium]|nr:class I tRNA ligase family protein [Patescibacteria group bacterium]
KGWTPEADTMDTFVDSSWYFLRYLDPENDQKFASAEAIKHWMPVDLYIGGAEHTCMHLLYARFFVKAMKKIGLIDFDEPFIKLRHQGIVRDKVGKKMSKSKGNVVSPDEMIERFGADATRAYMLFVSPLEDDIIWNEENIIGVYRFLEKVWNLKSLIINYESQITNNKIEKLVHKTIKKVSEDIKELKFNTAISALMILVNEMEKQKEVTVVNYQLLITLLSPFAPHLAEELWAQLGNEEFILMQNWPKYDLELTKDKIINLVIQVNGKLRDVIEVAFDISEEDVKKIALKSEKIKKWLIGKEVVKIIFVKGKLLNIVIK